MRGPSPFRSALVQLDLLIFGRFLRPDIAAIGRREPRRRLSGRRAGRRFVRSPGRCGRPLGGAPRCARSAGRPSARRGRARRALAGLPPRCPVARAGRPRGLGAGLAGGPLPGGPPGGAPGRGLAPGASGRPAAASSAGAFGRRRVRLLAWRRLRDLPRGIGWGPPLRRGASPERGRRPSRAALALPRSGRHATRATLGRCERIVGLAARVRVARSLLPALRSFDRAAHRHRSHRRRRARLARRRRRGPRGERRARRRLRRRRLGGNKGSPGIFWRRAVGRRLLQIDRRDRTRARAQTRGFVGSGGWENDSRARRRAERGRERAPAFDGGSPAGGTGGRFAPPAMPGVFDGSATYVGAGGAGGAPGGRCGAISSTYRGHDWRPHLLAPAGHPCPQIGPRSTQGCSALEVYMSGDTGPSGWFRVRAVARVARWTGARTGDGDVCGICQMPFEGCARTWMETARAAGSQPSLLLRRCPFFGEVSCGDEAPVVWGQVCARVSPAVRLHVAADQDHVPDLSGAGVLPSPPTQRGANNSRGAPGVPRAPTPSYRRRSVSIAARGARPPWQLPARAARGGGAADAIATSGGSAEGACTRRPAPAAGRSRSASV